MNAPDKESRRRTRVPVYTRVTAYGDGAITSTQAVYCPVQGRSLPLEECATCASCEVVHTENQDRQYIQCRALANAPGGGGPTHADWELTDRVTRTEVVQVMNGSVVSVRSDLRVDALRSLLLERQIGGVPVVDTQGRPIGMVTKSDLLRGRVPRDDPQTVADVMTAVPLAVSEQTTLSQAAAHMAFEGLHRLPVVAEDGHIVGILSAIDILRWLARLDGFLMPDHTERQSHLE